MATIYAKNKNTGEWERVGPAANATDSTLTLAGSPADAKATGEAIDNIQIIIENLTAEDVGALSTDTVIPSSTSQLTNDSGFLTSYTETDPTVPAWAKAESKPSYDFSEITVTDTEAAKVALDIENGMVLNEKQTVMPSSSRWQSIAYGDGKFVAVSYSGIAAYSEDGITWTSATMPSSSNWNYVTYGNGKFVTVAYNISGGISVAYSEDGVTWHGSNTPLGDGYVSVAYGNGKFVATNIGGVAYSEDCINWTTVDGLDAVFYSVAYGNGKFVAISRNSNKAIYSEDGITWTNTTMPSSSNWYSVAYGNGKFVAVANSSTTSAYSEDGITWTNTTMPSYSNWYSVAYGNGKFVAVANSSTTSAYSEDGIIWTTSIMPNKDWYGVIYGDGKFVAPAFNSDTVVFSYDGITWYDGIRYISQNDTDITSDVFVALEYTHDKYQKKITGTQGQIVGFDESGNVIAFDIEKSMALKNVTHEMPFEALGNTRIAYGNGVFVATGGSTGNNYTNIAYSTDSVTWIAANMPVAAIWRDITYGNGIFVSIASGSNIAAYSTDGITWTQTEMPVSAPWCSVAYGDGMFVAVSGISSSSNIAAYSTDGITWTQTEIPKSRNWRFVTYGDGKFVSSVYDVNGTLNVAYSEDGMTWNLVDGYVVNVPYAKSIAYGNDMFVIAGRNKFAYSVDGIAWTVSEFPISTTVNTVIYVYDKFFAIHDSGIMYSYDGINWVQTPGYSKVIIYITYYNGKFVAVVNNSKTIVYSYDGINWSDSIQYISQNDTDVTSDVITVLYHTHDKYADKKHTHDEYATKEQYQQKITGTQGQVVGFDENGNIIAQDMPSGIPEVTIADNGRFLRVVNGAWAVAVVPNAEEVLF